jgi:hypothetical protein
MKNNTTNTSVAKGLLIADFVGKGILMSDFAGKGIIVLGKGIIVL